MTLDMTSERTRRSRLPAFQYPDYRLLFINSFFAAASNWAMILGRGWLVYELTDSAAAVGLVTFAGMASFLLAPIAGAVADRVDRKRMAMTGSAVSALSAAILGAVVLADTVAVWHIVLLALVGGAGRAISMPAENAMIPNLVPAEHLLNAIAFSSISVHGSRIAGPLVGGVLLEFVGAGAVFLLSAVLSLSGIVALSRISQALRPLEARAERLSLAALVRRTGTDMREGVRYIESDRRVVLVLALVTTHCALTMAFDSMMPTLSTQLGGANRTYTAILVGIGAGAIMGTFAVSLVRTSRVQGAALAIAGGGSGLALLVLGFAPTATVGVLGAALAGATQATFMALSSTLVQQIVPDAVRGRVMSVYIMLAAGHMAFLNFGFGWLADSTGVRVLLIAPGLVWTALFAAAIVGLPDVRHMLRTGGFRVRPAASSVPVAGGD